jgi:lipoate-protein ligase A
MPLAAPRSQQVLRWLNLGHLSAPALHQSYQALAELRRAEDPPWLLLASANAHLSLGAAQTAAAELDRDAAQNLIVVQRLVGGGLVWIEPAHLNYFLLATPSSVRRRPEDWLEVLAPSLCALHAAFGLHVELVAEQELRCAGQRIGSTGAASLGSSVVLAGSFLLRGDWVSFCNSVAVPSPDFRQALERALAASLLTWKEAGVLVPSHEQLALVWREILQAEGWQIEVDALRPAEQQAIAAQELEPVDWKSQGRRRVRDGIKLRAGAFLTERHWPEGWLRVWTEDGRYRAVDSNIFPAELCWALTGIEAVSPMLPLLLEGYLGTQAALWQQRLGSLAVWSDHQ